MAHKLRFPRKNIHYTALLLHLHIDFTCEANGVSKQVHTICSLLLMHTEISMNKMVFPGMDIHSAVCLNTYALWTWPNLRFLSWTYFTQFTSHAYVRCKSINWKQWHALHWYRNWAFQAKTYITQPHMRAWSPFVHQLGSMQVHTIHSLALHARTRTLVANKIVFHRVDIH